MDNTNNVISKIEEIQMINREIIMSGIHEDITKKKSKNIQITRLRELAGDLKSAKIFDFDISNDEALLKSVKKFCSTY